MLLAFAGFPEYDVAAPRPLLHFYIVTFVSFTAVLLTALVSYTLDQNSPTRHHLLATAGLSMGIIFFIHGLTTPQALTYTTNPGVGWAAWLTLFVGGVLFAIADFDKPSTDKPNRIISRFRLCQINAIVYAFVIVFGLIVLFVPNWLTAVELVFAPYHQTIVFILLTLLAWGVAL